GSSVRDVLDLADVPAATDGLIPTNHSQTVSRNHYLTRLSRFVFPSGSVVVISSSLKETLSRFFLVLSLKVISTSIVSSSTNLYLPLISTLRMVMVIVPSLRYSMIVSMPMSHLPTISSLFLPP